MPTFFKLLKKKKKKILSHLKILLNHHKKRFFFLITYRITYFFLIKNIIKNSSNIKILQLFKKINKKNIFLFLYMIFQILK